MQSEIQIQAQCWQWCWNTYPQTRLCMWHVPNGGSRNKIEATQLKASGVVKGIQDIHFIWNRWFYLFEFKTPDGVISKDQKAVHAAHAAQGFTTEIIRSVEQFKQRITQIINTQQ